MPEEEGKKVMQFTTSWKEEGLQEGRQEALVEVAIALLGLRLGSVPAEIEAQVRGLTISHLKDLAIAQDAFDSEDDVRRWLADRT